MSSTKLQSFQEFSSANKIVQTEKLEEERGAARQTSADTFKNLLAEFGATSLKDLNEEDRTIFFSKLGASPVTEALAIIEEGTRSQIGKIKKNGKIEAVYMHYDGYPDNMLPIIKKGYSDGKAVDTLLKKGGGSGLAAKIEDINFYNDKTPNTTGDIKNVEKFVKDAANNGGAEFIYLYSEKDSKWYMVDVYDSYDLDPAFESLNSMIINEKFVPSKGNLRDAKKVAKVWESFFTEYVALADKDMMLGCIKYLVAEALTDANFHRYRDPVSKKIGGKITTVMVEIDRLGGTQIPVSKKSIINMIDSTGSDIANAAGWSGIGIVEGTALFLDGWGYSNIAEAIVTEFNLIYANESVMNEGNAFLAARAKAIEEDAEEFEFNGKNFPVINNSAEVSEGNEFGAARAKAIADGKDEFEVDGETYPVKSVDKEDKENAKDFVEEGNAFGAARAKAIADGEKTFKVGDEEYDVDSVDKEDKENAKDFVEESKVNEAEVKSDEDFKEYAFSVLKKAFGEDFDEAKAQEVVDGLLSKHGDEYGAAIGALTSSLG